MRIIGGKLRGSRLAVPDRQGLRPTPDRVRETVFNWLAPIVADARCLDLFAGTGAMGIEALSRGAGACTFVERDPDLVRLLEDNLARLGVATGHVVRADVTAMLSGPAQPFDLVFLDPPFAANLWEQPAELLERRGWLKPDAWIHVETPAGSPLAFPDAWSLHRQGRAGAMRHLLYRRIAR
ncbi:MAG TPA: 16S rRNA (guanine(966)-N(2))-methyltransferase RsmD [Rhodanobacteraceae bacterium]|nr:16S rRNA (guanine(966)-N(2))-methyltransferase RsmD [Rhodanobacteraceae bacterium]